MADPQYCLLAIEHWSTCMTKSEWASWTQALGSILAIAATGWGVYWQVDRAQKSERDKERNRRLANLIHLRSIVDGARMHAHEHKVTYATYETVLEMGSHRSWPSLDEFRLAASQLDDFRPSDIPLRAFHVASGVARQARRLVAITDQIQERWAAGSDEFLSRRAQLETVYPTFVLAADAMAHEIEDFAA